MLEAIPDIQGRVLIMDNDLARAARLCGRLIYAGWWISRASELTQSLAGVKDGQVDIALLHLSAAEADALDLPRVLRLAAGVPHLPIVILADNPQEQTRCQFLDCGADEIIADTVSPAELAARLRALLRVKLLQDQLQSSREALAASLARERALLTQLRRDNAHLLTLATTDPLTHLQNVRQFDSFLQSEFRIARRYNRPLSVMVFDLDHFKLVNDAHGHPVGDYVLKEFAVILKRTVRDSDLVARTGGEEFSIILPNTRREQSESFAQRIHNAVGGHRFNAYGQAIHISTSIGLASYPEDAETADAHMLVYFADQALLHAKQLGRDRVVAFRDMDATARRRLREQFVEAQPVRHAHKHQAVEVAEKAG